MAGSVLAFFAMMQAGGGGGGGAGDGTTQVCSSGKSGVRGASVG